MADYESGDEEEFRPKTTPPGSDRVQPTDALTTRRAGSREPEVEGQPLGRQLGRPVTHYQVRAYSNCAI